MKKALTWGGGLIALYLIVANASGVKTAAGAGFSGVSQLVRSLQGRI